jgi:hypothetical protein
MISAGIVLLLLIVMGAHWAFAEGVPNNNCAFVGFSVYPCGNNDGYSTKRHAQLLATDSCFLFSRLPTN